MAQGRFDDAEGVLQEALDKVLALLFVEAWSAKNECLFGNCRSVGHRSNILRCVLFYCHFTNCMISRQPRKDCYMLNRHILSYFKPCCLFILEGIAQISHAHLIPFLDLKLFNV